MKQEEIRVVLLYCEMAPVTMITLAPISGVSKFASHRKVQS
jgi:hypothetical protein